MKLFANKKMTTLVLLLIIFITPGLLAVYFFQHPEALRKMTVNQGRFVNTPLKMLALGKPDTWKLLIWQPADCQEACKAELDRLARMRLALGRRLYDVEAWLVLDSHAKAPSANIAKFLEQSDIHLHRLSAENRELKALLNNHGAIFIVSPERDFVLTYAEDTQTKAIFADMKRLLATSRPVGGLAYAR